VGYQCVDCVSEQAAQNVRRPVTVGGGRVGQRTVVVPVLIALNVAAFVVTAGQAGSIARNDASPLYRAWSMVPQVVAADGEWWRLLTNGFLHFGPIHLLLNMLALYLLGRELEPVLGAGRFLSVYLVSLLGGSVAALLLQAPNDHLAGASGAVFGLMGGLVVVVRRLRLPLGPLATLIAMNLVISFVVPFISWSAHIGGLLVGAAATAALVYAPARNRTAWQAGTLGGLTALLLLIAFSWSVL
jgi:membrane associated rhomboid family serine protease